MTRCVSALHDEISLSAVRCTARSCNDKRIMTLLTAMHARAFSESKGAGNELCGRLFISSDMPRKSKHRDRNVGLCVRG